MRLDISLISKYRAQLMGFAILWIVFYHMPLVFYIPVISEIKWLGATGVDIFFLVSGLGMYFSWKKHPSTKNFIKRRLIRIYSLYLPITIIYYTIAIIWLSYSPVSLFYSTTTLDYWLGLGDRSYTPWFIPAITFMYLITPAIFKMSNKIGLVRICLLLSIITILLAYYVPSFQAELTRRMPNYFIGLVIGHHISTNKNIIIGFKSFLLFVITLLVALVYIITIIHYEPLRALFGFESIYLILIPLILPICLFLSKILDTIKTYKYPILSFFGKYSLPIYLTNERILYILEYYLKTTSKTVICIVALALTVILSYFVQNIIYKYTDNLK